MSPLHIIHMPECHLFAAHTRGLTTLENTVVRYGHSFHGHCVKNLGDTDHWGRAIEPTPDFADRPYTDNWHTRVYIAHFIHDSFTFCPSGTRFTATDFLRHLREHSGHCDRAVFASCLAFRDVWHEIADTLGVADRTVPVLICAKLDPHKLLTDKAVYAWLSELDWSKHSLGLGPLNDMGGVVHKANLKWRWMLL